MDDKDDDAVTEERIDAQLEALGEELVETFGEFNSNDRVVGLLYDLMSEHLPVRTVLRLVAAQIHLKDDDYEGFVFTNFSLAKTAEFLSGKLRETDTPAEPPEPPEPQELRTMITHMRVALEAWERAYAYMFGHAGEHTVHNRHGHQLSIHPFTLARELGHKALESAERKPG